MISYSTTDKQFHAVYRGVEIVGPSYFAVCRDLRAAKRKARKPRKVTTMLILGGREEYQWWLYQKQPDHPVYNRP
jgi:hypothetical protein